MAGILALYAALVRGNVAANPYGYDEADYMYAAGLGLAANFTDSPSLSLPAFVHAGLGRGPASSARTALSESIRGSNDVVFYRHWHGPLYGYFLMFPSALHVDEHAARAAMLIFPLLAAIGIYLGCLWLLPGTPGRLAAVLSAALFLWDFATVKTTELAPHQLFALCYLVALFLLAKTAATGRRRYWYAAVVASGLAFSTLEVAFVLAPVLALCCWFERQRLQPDWKFLARSLLAFVATVLVIWPGAIFKLSFVKAYAFMAYLAVFRKSPWGNVSFADTWLMRFRDSPIAWLLIAGAFAVYLSGRRFEGRPFLYPFPVYAVLMIAAVLRVNTDTPRYLLPFLPALAVFAGLVWAGVLAERTRAVRLPLVAALLIAIFLSSLVRLRAHAPTPDPRPAAVLACIDDRHLDGKRLLVPQGDVPTIHYYFPNTRLSGYLEDAPPETAAYDGVLYPGYPVRCEASPPR